MTTISDCGSSRLNGIRDYLNYNPETGLFTWAKRRGTKIAAGSTAGCADAQGYIAICFNGFRYRAHRLAWMFVHGEMPPPEMDVDHIDRNKSNNSISNLRLATKSQNKMNTSILPTNSTGAKGVTYRKAVNKFVARIKVDKKPIHLGYFESIADAKTAYEEASRKYHGEFGNTDSRIG